MQYLLTHEVSRVPWIKSKIMGQKPPLKRNEIRAIRVRLQIRGRVRDLVLFNLAIDSKLRACDLVRLRVVDVTQTNQVARRAITCIEFAQKAFRRSSTKTGTRQGHDETATATRVLFEAPSPALPRRTCGNDES